MKCSATFTKALKIGLPKRFAFLNPRRLDQIRDGGITISTWSPCSIDLKPELKIKVAGSPNISALVTPRFRSHSRVATSLTHDKLAASLSNLISSRARPDGLCVVEAKAEPVPIPMRKSGTRSSFNAETSRVTPHGQPQAPS